MDSPLDPPPRPTPAERWQRVKAVTRSGPGPSAGPTATAISPMPARVTTPCNQRCGRSLGATLKAEKHFETPAGPLAMRCGDRAGDWLVRRSLPPGPRARPRRDGRRLSGGAPTTVREARRDQGVPAVSSRESRAGGSSRSGGFSRRWTIRTSRGCSTPARPTAACRTSSWSTSRASRSTLLRDAAAVRARTARLFRRVCAAVQYAHQRLVVHRDIKARNILVTADGAPKLLDFGIAKLLDPGVATTRDADHVPRADARERQPRAGPRRSGHRVDRRLLARGAAVPAAHRPESVRFAGAE